MNTPTVKRFRDFNIKPVLSAFTGEKININNILNVEITIKDFKIEDSRKKAGTKLLTLQILYNGALRIVFTGSTVLQEMIKEVPKTDFPFNTTIVRQDQHLEFT